MLNILISLILFTLCLSDVTDISELMSSIDLTETSIISYLNTTSEDRIQNAAALSVTGKIMMNDLFCALAEACHGISAPLRHANTVSIASARHSQRAVSIAEIRYHGGFHLTAANRNPEFIGGHFHAVYQ